MIGVYLGRLGYQVTSCEDAKSGLEALKTNPDGFQLVLADLTLPDLPGQEMSVQMMDISPALRVLICSGYPFDIESMPADKRERVGVLQKPFLPDMLKSSVSELLAR